MNEKKIKRLWPFECYDFELINTYLNERANQGEALEYIGMVFGIYKKTVPGEYKYCVDHIKTCHVYSKEFQNYKKSWIDEGWEYVDFFKEMIIYQCKNQDSYIQPSINLQKIREDIKKQAKSQWLPLAILILLAGVNIFFSEFKLAWTIILAIQFLQFDSFLTYLNLKKSSKVGFNDYDQLTAEKCIKKIFIMRSIKKILASIFLILLLLILIFYYKSTFLAQCAIVAIVVIIGSIVYKRVKLQKLTKGRGTL